MVEAHHTVVRHKELMPMLHVFLFSTDWLSSLWWAGWHQASDTETTGSLLISVCSWDLFHLNICGGSIDTCTYSHSVLAVILRGNVSFRVLFIKSSWTLTELPHKGLSVFLPRGVLSRSPAPFGIIKEKLLMNLSLWKCQITAYSRRWYLQINNCSTGSRIITGFNCT